MHGATLETSTIMAPDHESGRRHCVTGLQMVATRFGNHLRRWFPARSVFEKVLKPNEKDAAGYLCLVNARRGLYQVTAKGRTPARESSPSCRRTMGNHEGALDEDSEGRNSRLIYEKQGSILTHDALGALASPPRR